MPLAGYMCCRDGKPHDFDDCLAANREGLCQHSLSLLSAMQLNARRRAGIGISSSVLNVCPRQYILSQEHDYYESPADFYNRWRGSFGHYAIEMGGPYTGIVQEVRFYRTISVEGVPFTISGQPDWVDIGRQHISDAKFVARAPNAPYQDHENQINVYAWLLEGGYTMYGGRQLHISSKVGWDYSLPDDWEAQTADVNYMDAKGEHIYPVILWTEEARERFITQRLTPYKQYSETGSLAVIGTRGKENKWKGKFCPFMRDENPGTCCMVDQDFQNLEAA